MENPKKSCNSLEVKEEIQERYEDVEKPIDDLKREIFRFKDMYHMKDLERIEYLLVRIYDLLYERKQVNQKKAKIVLTTDEVMERFSITKQTAIRVFSLKGSPAFKLGSGRGHWRVNEDDFKKFLIKQSERYKG